VCNQETSEKKAKTRYLAVEYTTTSCNAKKTNKHHINRVTLMVCVSQDDAVDIAISNGLRGAGFEIRDGKSFSFP
jgi:RES domain-containing protein